MCVQNESNVPAGTFSVAIGRNRAVPKARIDAQERNVPAGTLCVGRVSASRCLVLRNKRGECSCRNIRRAGRGGSTDAAESTTANQTSALAWRPDDASSSGFGEFDGNVPAGTFLRSPGSLDRGPCALVPLPARL